MKNVTTLLFMISMLTLSSCQVIGDIFGAGVYTGIFLVVFVIVMIGVIVLRLFRRK